MSIELEDNLAAWLLANGEPNAIALLSGQRSHTYEELHHRVRQIAAVVLETTRGTANPIVPIIADTSFESAAAHLGVLYAGASSAPLPPMSDVALRAVLKDMRALLLFVEPRAVERVRALTEARVFAIDEELANEVAAPKAVDRRGQAILLYTSGSTGRPRGVMLSSTNVRANIAAIDAILPPDRSARAMLAMPLHYCYGLSVLHAHLRAGASTVLSSRLYPQEILVELKTSEATGLPGVPTLFQTLLDRSSLPRERLTKLRYLMISGGRSNPQMIERLRSLLPETKIYLRYGVTELTAAASCLEPERIDEKSGSIGRGLPGVSFRVLDVGEPVASGSGAIGEVVVSGETVALGYFNEPEESARYFRDGAFFTGDLATVDRDGYIFIVGRARDFIKTAGHRVSPHEIEDALCRLPSVAEAVVCGTQHDVLGEALVACIVVKDGSEITEGELRRHCAAQLPSYMSPLEYRFLSALPRSDRGKVDRTAVRQLLSNAPERDLT